MFKLAPYAAAAAAAVAVASPASAALTVTQDPDPCVAGATVCTFDFDGVVTVDGAFAQSAAFTLPDAGAFNGGLLPPRFRLVRVTSTSRVFT